MTLKELSQLYYLNQEIERETRRLAKLEAAATDTSAKIDGLPHIGGMSDKTALAAEIADCKAVIEAKLKLCLIEYNRLHRYINSVEDSLTRQILQARFVDGLSWRQVAASVGGNNTEENVRQIAYRYVKQS